LTSRLVNYLTFDISSSLFFLSDISRNNLIITELERFYGSKKWANFYLP
jgi:hypothetical protein